MNSNLKVSNNDPKLDKVLRGLCVCGRLAEAIGLLCRSDEKELEDTNNLQTETWINC